MQSVVNKIMLQIQQNGPGYIFTPKDFLDFGTRQSIDTALSRLAAQGDIRRLARGLYDYPKKHALLGDLLPSLDDVAKVIAKDANSTIQISGARALYLLGLTTQVPAQIVYLTDGRSRDVKIGNTVLKMRHASLKIMAGAGKKAGAILQAIRYLGRDHLDDDIINKIKRRLSNDDKQALKQIAKYAPGWTKPTIDRMVAA